MMDLSKNFKPSYCGWKVNHNFRYKTKGGNNSLLIFIYIINNPLEEIIHYYNSDSEKEEYLRYIIKEAFNSTEKM